MAIIPFVVKPVYKWISTLQKEGSKWIVRCIRTLEYPNIGEDIKKKQCFPNIDKYINILPVTYFYYSDFRNAKIL